MSDNATSKKKYFSVRIKHCDGVAKQFVTNFNSYYHQYLERIDQYLVPEGLNVLEVGCGKGDLRAAVKPYQMNNNKFLVRVCSTSRMVSQGKLSQEDDFETC